VPPHHTLAVGSSVAVWPACGRCQVPWRSTPRSGLYTWRCEPAAGSIISPRHQHRRRQQRRRVLTAAGAEAPAPLTLPCRVVQFGVAG